LTDRYLPCQTRDHIVNVKIVENLGAAGRGTGGRGRGRREDRSAERFLHECTEYSRLASRPFVGSSAEFLETLFRAGVKEGGGISKSRIDYSRMIVKLVLIL